MTRRRRDVPGTRDVGARRRPGERGPVQGRPARGKYRGKYASASSQTMLAFAGRASSLAACMSLLSALSLFCVFFFLTGEYGGVPPLQRTGSDLDTRALPGPQTSLDRHDVAAPSSSTETARSPAVVNISVSTTVNHGTAVSTGATSAKPAITEERTAPTQGKTTASISAITQAAVVNTVTKTHPTRTNSNGLYLSVPENCAEPNCMEFLSLSEKRAIQLCEKDVARRAPDRKIQSTTCKFLKGDGRDPVALNSQEGSGNTWVRALLERATGVCTGFNWGCDPVLRAHGFLGEGIRSGRVLVVKTHVRTPKWKGEVWKGPMLGYEPFYTSAVLILRNPARAMIADYNRQRTTTKGLDSHTNTLSQAMFGEMMATIVSIINTVGCIINSIALFLLYFH